MPRGLLWNLGSSALPIAGSFVVSLLIAPYLGPAGFGQYVSMTAAASMLLIVAKYGVHAATSRLVTEHEEEAGTWIRSGLRVRMLFTLPITVLALAFSPWLARALEGPALVPAFWMVGPLVLATSAYELGTEAMIGLRRFGPLFFVRMMFLAARLAAVAWVRLSSLGAAAFCVGHTIAQAVPGGLALGDLLRRYPDHATKEHKREADRRTLQISTPLAISSASFLVYAQIDRLMLAWLRTSAEVGQFGVARNVLDAALFPSVALAWSLRPALVEAVARHKGTDAWRPPLAEGLRLSVVCALGLPALLLAFGAPLVVAFYGRQYAVAGDLLLWSLPILLMRGLGTVIFPALLATDRQAVYARLMVWTALLDVVANLALIPPLGARGAIVGTVIALVPLTVGGFVEVRKAMGPLPWGVHRRSHLVTLGVSVAVGVGGLLLWPRHTPIVPLLLAAFAAAALLAVVTLGVAPRTSGRVTGPGAGNP